MMTLQPRSVETSQTSASVGMLGGFWTLPNVLAPIHIVNLRTHLDDDELGRALDLGEEGVQDGVDLVEDLAGCAEEEGQAGDAAGRGGQVAEPDEGLGEERGDGRRACASCMREWKLGSASHANAPS
jgi:hypothetical protein